MKLFKFDISRNLSAIGVADDEDVVLTCAGFSGEDNIDAAETLISTLLANLHLVQAPDKVKQVTIDELLTMLHLEVTPVYIKNFDA